MTSGEYIAFAGALITGASFLLAIGTRLWKFSRRLTIIEEATKRIPLLEERLMLLYQAQYRRGHFEMIEKGYAQEVPLIQSTSEEEEDQP